MAANPACARFEGLQVEMFLGNNIQSSLATGVEAPGPEVGGGAML